MRLLFLCVVLALASCKTSSNSSIKKVSFQNEAGAFVVAKKGDLMLITPCQRPLKIVTGQDGEPDCVIKPGEEIKEVQEHYFREDLRRAYHLHMSDPAVSASVGKDLEDQRRTLEEEAKVFEEEKKQTLENISQIEGMLETYSGKGSDLQPFISAKTQLKAQLARVKADLSQNKVDQNTIGTANKELGDFIDVLIADSSSVYPVERDADGDGEVDLFFGVLDSYFTLDDVKEENLSSPDRFEMEVIPPAGIERPFKFVMGSPDGRTVINGEKRAKEVDRDNDEFPHEVEISRRFKMMKYEVTRKQWESVIGKNLRDFDNNPQNPIEYVTWDEVQNFIEKLNRYHPEGPRACGNAESGLQETQADFAKAWSTRGCYRLPTEAEWEYAARAGTSTAFNTGRNITTAQANYYGNNPYNGAAKGEDRRTTVPVGSLSQQPGGEKNKNAWGLYDMHGNVWEWVQDWHGADYYNTKEAKLNDPMGPSSGSYRVNRGGGWYNGGRFARSAIRGRDSAGYRINFLGFRLSRTL